MGRLLVLAVLVLLSLGAYSQGFEISSLQESYKGVIGETIKAPIRFRNTTDKPIILIVRKVTEQIGSTQKNYFCLDQNCMDQKVEDYIIKVEAGQTLSSFQVALEAGLVPGISSVKYLAYNKSNPTQTIEFELNFTVDEKPEKPAIYASRFITVNNVYPNPATDHAFVDYRMIGDHIKATIRVHNILGNAVGEYDLSSAENLMRIKTDDLSAGIYFYTLYIDNESVMTRKLIVKK
jgi:hypothetical protein